MDPNSQPFLPLEKTRSAHGNEGTNGGNDADGFAGQITPHAPLGYL